MISFQNKNNSPSDNRRLAVMLNVGWILVLFAVPALAQHESEVKKISEIESAKKLKVTRLTTAELKDYNAGADTANMVTEVTQFDSKQGVVKTITRTKYSGTVVKRTCYFEKGNKLFAVNDSIAYSDHSKRVFTYFIAAGHFTAVDADRKDATQVIDQQEIYDWLRNVFSEQMVEAWKPK